MKDISLHERSLPPISFNASRDRDDKADTAMIWQVFVGQEPLMTLNNIARKP